MDEVEGQRLAHPPPSSLSLHPSTDTPVGNHTDMRSQRNGRPVLPVTPPPHPPSPLQGSSPPHLSTAWQRTWRSSAHYVLRKRGECDAGGRGVGGSSRWLPPVSVMSVRPCAVSTVANGGAAAASSTTEENQGTKTKLTYVSKKKLTSSKSSYCKSRSLIYLFV